MAPRDITAASGAATMLRPGTSSENSNARAPRHMKWASVQRTHESGSREIPTDQPQDAAAAKLSQSVPSEVRQEGRKGNQATPDTTKSGLSSGNPLSACLPRSSNPTPDPTTRSLTFIRDEHFSRTRRRHDASADVDRDTTDLVAEHFALARMRPADPFRALDT